MNKIALRIGINRHWNHLYYQGLSYVDPRYPLPFWNILKQDQTALKVLKGFYPLSKIEIHKTREVIDIYICRDRYVNYPLISGRLLGAHSQSSRISFPLLGSSERVPPARDPRPFGKIFKFKNFPFGSMSSTPIVSKPPIVEIANVTVGSSAQINVDTLKGTSHLSDLRMYRALLNIFKTRIQIFNLYTFPIHEAELLVGYLLREGGTNSPLPHKNKARLNAFRRLWKMGIIKGIKIKIQGRYKKSTRTQNEAYQFGQIPNTPTTNLRIKLFYATRVLLQSLGTSSLHIYIVYAPHTGRAYKPLY